MCLQEFAVQCLTVRNWLIIMLHTAIARCYNRARQSEKGQEEEDGLGSCRSRIDAIYGKSWLDGLFLTGHCFFVVIPQMILPML